ncbi:MAG: site-2 protease family protein [Planctomycetota bacterium]
MIPELLRQAGNLAMVIIGFGLIVFIHELGHFLAARWAGVRVLGFALGFGPAAISYRRGLGLRRGSSEPEYAELVNDARSEDAEKRELARARLAGEVSPTEYRLNVLPLGGYVKMLGQEDLNPEATSDAPDSYQNAPVAKRMVIISAGVIANIVSAALLFVIVFMVGLMSEPAMVGSVSPGSPAAEALAIDADQIPEDERRLLPGDRVLTINDAKAASFQDLFIASALAGPGEPVRLSVQRDGREAPLSFSIVPERGEVTGMLEMGIGPAISTTLLDARTSSRADFDAVMSGAGFPGLEPASRLIEIDGSPITLASAYADAIDASAGASVKLTFEQPSGERVSFETRGTPELAVALRDVGENTRSISRHLLGLVPLMQVAEGDPSGAGYQQGLRAGDVFAQLGEREFPTQEQGVAEIQRRAGQTIDAVMLRDGERVPLTLRVTREGRVGFNVTDSSDSQTLVTPAQAGSTDSRGEPSRTTLSGAISRPGTSVARVWITGDADVQVEPETLLGLREALRTLTAGAFEAGTGAEIGISLVLPVRNDGGSPLTEDRTVAVSAQDVAALHELGYAPPLPLGLFQPVQELLKASGPIDAVGMGLHETKRIMISAYLTLARLFQGTVQVQHLNGPVGIAHIGTRIADRGLIWLLFFGALVSVNLAVINFLPLPIVDGGQFLMLLWEAVRGKPVPIPVQNVVTLAGLVMIGTVFLIVTYNDIARLIGS